MDILIAKIKKLSKNCGIDELEQIENLLEQRLKQEPNNIELWLRLAILELVPPLVDHEKSLICLNKILSIDENNPIAILLIAYINYYFLAGIDVTIKNKLVSIYTNDKEINSMILYAISWFYSDTNSELEKQFLEQSIDEFPQHVFNYIKLAELYFKQNKNMEAEKFIHRALQNIKQVFPNNYEDDYDVTDINTFLNESIKGIYVSNVYLDYLKSLLKN